MQFSWRVWEEEEEGANFMRDLVVFSPLDVLSGE